MRKASVQLVTQTSEPLIVVDEDDGERTKDNDHSFNSSSEESPTHFKNQCLLSPWRDARETRKLSLPSPQCTGITASQVRRLSERGEGGSGPGPRQTEFLATLSQAPGPQQSGRRHSVVTISKLPSVQRSRRESIAVCGGPSRVLGGRRESSAGPPSTEPRGSVHNLQLDIMDDIVQSRKVRMKIWNTSNENICEIKDEAGGVQKYTGNRRYSEFVGTALTPIPSSFRRRASELPTPALPSADVEEATRKQARAPGIVCSNTDLISILSNLTASATDLNQCSKPMKEDVRPPTLTPPPPVRPSASGINADASTSCVSTTSAGSKVEMKGWKTRRARLRNSRSNSFDDASILHAAGGCEWFARRHQPMAAKTGSKAETDAGRKSPPKVVWDGRSGSVVDASVLGTAIEDFLRRDSQQNLVKQPLAKKLPQSQTKPKGWFASTRGADSEEAGATPTTCDSSICATLKDLFVK